MFLACRKNGWMMNRRLVKNTVVMKVVDGVENRGGLTMRFSKQRVDAPCASTAAAPSAACFSGRNRSRNSRSVNTFLYRNLRFPFRNFEHIDSL